MGQPTIYRALALLQGVLQRAVEWQRLPQNPVELVRKPQVRRLRDVRPLPPATVEELRAAAGTARTQGDRKATLICVLAYAGLRPQEALALTWGDVRDRKLLIDKASDGEGQAHEDRPVAHRPAPRPLAADLLRWRLISVRPDDDARVFPSPSGGVWNDAHWQTWHRDVWRRACRRIGLNGVRPYDLRHGFVSLLIQEGRHVVDVARQAGHSPTMTSTSTATSSTSSIPLIAYPLTSRSGAPEKTMCPFRVRPRTMTWATGKKALQTLTTPKSSPRSPS